MTINPLELTVLCSLAAEPIARMSFCDRHTLRSHHLLGLLHTPVHLLMMVSLLAKVTDHELVV